MSQIRPTIAAAVDRLLVQYKEYYVHDACAQDAKRKHEQYLLERAKSTNKSLQEVVELAASGDKDLSQYKRQQRTHERMRDRISDEMTFATPEIWMRYKALAYAGTPNAIETWEDFRQHCRPEGYICTKRYMFLKKVTEKNLHVRLDDLEGETPLLEVSGSDWLASLEKDHDVIEQWQAHEFFFDDNRVAKWESFE